MNFSTIPWRVLPTSTRVDFLQLAAGAKPAIRVCPITSSTEVTDLLERWAQAEGLGASSDGRYICIARTKVAANKVLRLDAAPNRHELDLGIALGYPRCCCAAVAALGEDRIDELDRTAGGWRFEGRFSLIDISGYRSGNALISHIPCSPRCEPSWVLADTAARWLQARTAAAPAKHEPWVTWKATLTLLVDD